ncbi:hypothetical protein [Mucilaginibacter rubeus]|uniref:Uncharacterized protein n=1 Tax=Mucilaginibacter rubeus TaxID=2027860 RepID=A0A5C1HVE2_9SPHI|nr:hypothetical protein [Mucilaginibacter rubeus]QEM09040.1 hypothetical protein DEO27_003080 [Mucilaginibacter rubeus]
MNEPKKLMGFLPNMDTPVIHAFTSDKEEVMANELVTLSWDTENAREVKLDDITQDGNLYTTTLTNTRTFNLVASGIFRKAQASKQVRLYIPQILLFDCKPTQIREGEPVSIVFRFKYGLSWKLMAEYTGLLLGQQEEVAKGAVQDGYGWTDQTIELTLKDICNLRLQVRNGAEISSDRIMLGTPPVKVALDSNKITAVPGSSINLTWRTENATGLWLNPGNIDLKGCNSYNLVVSGDHDLHLELIGKGDFGGHASDTRTIMIANINKFYVSDNNDGENPEFFLNWDTSRLKQLRLLPQNNPVDHLVEKYRMPAISDTGIYTLVGLTAEKDEITSSLTIKSCHIESFELDTGKAMIGTTAKLRWKANAARRLQLTFSDQLLPVDISPVITEHHFAVTKDCDYVTLTGWGDNNVMSLTVPVPRFIGPEIKTLTLSSIDVQLGIRWVESPAIPGSQLAGLIRSLRSNHSLPAQYNGAWRWVIFPVASMSAAFRPIMNWPFHVFTKILKNINYAPPRSNTPEE